MDWHHIQGGNLTSSIPRIYHDPDQDKELTEDD